MRIYPLLLCWIGLLLGPLASRGQRSQQPYSVQFSAHNSTDGSDFRVYITRTAGAISLRYGRLDSVQNKRLRADPRFITYASAAQADRLPAAEAMSTRKRFVALVEQYKVYRWDSLRVATTSAHPFLQALDSLHASSAAQLERTAANRNRIVLDGPSVHVVVQTGTHPAKDLYVQAPSATSHPVLYRVLHEALQRYRQAQPRSFLDQRFTGGY